VRWILNAFAVIAIVTISAPVFAEEGAKPASVKMEKKEEKKAAPEKKAAKKAKKNKVPPSYEGGGVPTNPDLKK